MDKLYSLAIVRLDTQVEYEIHIPVNTDMGGVQKIVASDAGSHHDPPNTWAPPYYTRAPPEYIRVLPNYQGSTQLHFNDICHLYVHVSVRFSFELSCFRFCNV